MSFFDKLSKAVNTVKKLQSALSEVEKNLSGDQSQSAPAAQRQQPQKTNFDQLLAEKFSEYEVRQNLTVSQVVPNFSSDVWYCTCGGRNEQLFCSGCGKKQPPRVTRNGYAKIPYVLYQDGQPKLAILLINSSRWNDTDIVSTMAACKSAGIPCQRYFKEFSNREDYVTNRIRQAL